MSPSKKLAILSQQITRSARDKEMAETKDSGFQALQLSTVDAARHENMSSVGLIICPSLARGRYNAAELLSQHDKRPEITSDEVVK